MNWKNKLKLYQRPNLCNRRAEYGFTLIEIMIVVALVGILSSIAISNYSNYSTRANRTEAIDKLAEISIQLERYYTRNRQYTADLTNLGYAADPVQTDRGLYSISADVCNGATARTCVELTAAPVAGQLQATDGNLTLDTRGRRTGKWTNEK